MTKNETKASYDETAGEFSEKVADLMPLESIERFTAMLPPKSKILDVGSGSGRDARAFTDRGLVVVGIDFSSKLLEIARSHAPLATFIEMDIQALSFPKSSFDGIWAAASLLHIPKNAIGSVLKNLHALLKDNGYLYLTVKKGIGEGVEKDARYNNQKKFWAYYEENELKTLVQEAGFTLIELVTIEKRDDYQTHPFLRVYARK